MLLQKHEKNENEIEAKQSGGHHFPNKDLWSQARV